MTVRLAQISGHPVDGTFATKLGMAVLSGTAGYVVGSKLAMKALHIIPGAGTLSAVGVTATLNGLFTLKLGRAIVNLFDKGEFDTQDYKAAGSSLIALVIALPTIDELRELVEVVTDPAVMTAGKDFIEVAKNAHVIVGMGISSMQNVSTATATEPHGFGDHLRTGKAAFDLLRDSVVSWGRVGAPLVTTDKMLPTGPPQRVSRSLIAAR